MLTLIAALVLTATHMLAGRLSKLHQLPRSRWLSAAGGVAVAYVFVHLLPELADGQRVMEDSGFHPLRYLEHHAYLLALVGLVCFYGLERLIKQTEKHALRRSMGEITAAHVMSRDLYWHTPDTFIEQAWQTLQVHRLRSLPVVQGDD